ncbi:MAG TPA: hypothetical protein VF902_01215, partial [Coriobacteriia bacterium]
ADTEIFTWTPAGGVVQLTANAKPDDAAQVSGDRVVWRGSGSGPGSEVFTWTPQGASVQLTANTVADNEPRVSDDRIVWFTDAGSGNFDVFTWTPAAGVVQLTSNSANDLYPEVSENRIVWYGVGGSDGGVDTEIFTAVQPTSITIKTNATTSRIGGIPILSGLVTPSGLVGKNIVVYVKKPGKSYWTYSSNRTVYSRYGVPSWQYKYYFKKGMAKGIYVYKAFVPTMLGFVASTSPTTVAIRVR